MIKEIKKIAVIYFIILAAAQAQASAALSPILSEKMLIKDQLGQEISVGKNSNTRLVDFNHDGLWDILIGNEAGEIKISLNYGTRQVPKFRRPVAVFFQGRPLVVGPWAGASLYDVTNDGVKDLVVAYNGGLIDYYPNSGSRAQPLFQQKITLARVNHSVNGRFDLGDYNGDGLFDLVTGDWGGAISFYPNTGSAGKPQFTTTEVNHSGVDPLPQRLPYLTSPQLIDLNGNGLLDLVVGINWGNLAVFFNDGGSIPQFKRQPLLDQYKINWHPTPSLADLNGDGLFDLVSGSHTGEAYLSWGGIRNTLDQINSLLQSHPWDLAIHLNQNPEVRKQLNLNFVGLNETLTLSYELPDKEKVLAFYHQLIAQYPQYFQSRSFNQTTEVDLNFLRANMWLGLIQAAKDQGERKALTQKIRLPDNLANIVIKYGVYLMENLKASPQQVHNVEKLLELTPRAIYALQVITIKDFLDPKGRAQIALHAPRGAVNIFGVEVGRASENPWPWATPEERRPYSSQRHDLFTQALAHELHHVSLDNRYAPAFSQSAFREKYKNIALAAGPNIFFDGDFRFDQQATQNHFRQRGYWDGVSDWNQAFDRFFKVGNPGYQRNFEFLRGQAGVSFFVKAPQEGFATMANLYYSDSLTMMKLAVYRWQKGYKNNIRQFLHFLDYFSHGKKFVPFVHTDEAGNVSWKNAVLVRNQGNQIGLIYYQEKTLQIDYDQEGELRDLYLFE